jgi:hypothetical protein
MVLDRDIGMRQCLINGKRYLSFNYQPRRLKMEKQITLTADQAYALVDKLMVAAGRLSDIQELKGEEMDKLTNDLLNSTKKHIFDVMDQINPRR